jgi:hypothetical protein
MAAINGATTATSIADTKLTEVISRLVRYAVQTPYVAMGFCHVPDLLVGTDTYKHPFWPQLTAAAAHTQTDLVNIEELVATTDNDVTTAEYSRGMAISDRAQRLSTSPLLVVAVNRVIDACMRKIESSALTLATSITTSQGSAATNHTALNLVSVLSAFMAQGKSSALLPVMISSVSANRDLLSDLATNAGAVFSSSVGAQMHAALSGTNQGLFRDLQGVMLAVTDGVVAADTTGKGNFLCHVGPEECAIVCAFGKAPSAEYVRRGELQTDIVAGSVDFGVGIVNQARAYEFITRA